MADWYDCDVGARSSPFKVPAHYKLKKVVARCLSSQTCSFEDTTKSENVLVTKHENAFADTFCASRLLHELTLLRQLQPHENIHQILDVFPPHHPDFKDVYVVWEACDADLQRVIRSKQELTEQHHQYLTYQILRGLKYLHSVDIVHRGLMPRNVLCNRNCDVKISDFACARVIGGQPPLQSDDNLSRDPDIGGSCLWFKAPEAAMSLPCAKSEDIWSTACILAELIGRKPLFRSSSLPDLIKRIMSVLGHSAEQDLQWLPERARAFVQKLPLQCKQAWPSVLATCGEQACEALDRMLTFSPRERPDVCECLRLPYFAEFHDEADEPVSMRVPDLPTMPSLDENAVKRQLQNHVYAEAARYHPEITLRDHDMLASRGIDRVLATRLVLTVQVLEGVATCYAMNGEEAASIPLDHEDLASVKDLRALLNTKLEQCDVELVSSAGALIDDRTLLSELSPEPHKAS